MIEIIIGILAVIAWIAGVLFTMYRFEHGGFLDPLGWTDLKPLAMDRLQPWQQQHSEFYQEQQSND